MIMEFKAVYMTQSGFCRSGISKKCWDGKNVVSKFIHRNAEYKNSTRRK